MSGKSDNKDAGSVQEEIRKGLPALAAATGAPSVGDGRNLPTVNVALPAGALCEQVAGVLHSAPLFFFAGEFVTISPRGDLEPMTAARFRSWVESYVGFVRHTADNSTRAESIGQDKAALLLASDAMRRHIRELEAVHSVRLPVWRRGDSEKTLELLPSGFDTSTKVFTVDGISFDKELPQSLALAWFADRLGEFPWFEQGDLTQSRSFAAAIAAMVGVFCRHLYGLRPMILVNGNQSGTGKSKLSRVILAPVHGALAEDDKPKGDEELRKKLDAIALDRAPYLFLDDCSSLASHALNRFITSPIHAGRVLTQSTRFKEPNVTQVVATGNGVNVTPDLARRSLVIDLFCAEEATKRTIRQPLDDVWLQEDQFRSEALAAIWALCREWGKAGCPRKEEVTGSTFSEYRAVVGGIVGHSGMPDPFAERECKTGGDESGAALESVLCDLAEGADAGVSWTCQEIIDRAEDLGLLEAIVPFAKDAAKALGHRLRKLKGRVFRTAACRRFEFSRRDRNTGASYPIRFIEEEDEP